MSGYNNYEAVIDFFISLSDKAHYSIKYRTRCGKNIMVTTEQLIIYKQIHKKKADVEITATESYQI